MFHAEEKGWLDKSKTASFELKILFGHWSWSQNGWRYPKIAILPAFSPALSILIVRILLLWSELFKKKNIVLRERIRHGKLAINVNVLLGNYFIPY